jgi:hypothetical protein
MPKPELRATFAALREILRPHSKTLLVDVDSDAEYRLCSRTLKDRIGKPLFVAAVQTRKNYVSYHLMPIYMNPRLAKSIPAGLAKRMQGKACFNFRSPAEAEARADELAALTRAGIDSFRNAKLPWADRKG